MATIQNQATEKQETGTALMFTGLSVWVAALLVLFFLPSGYKVGRESTLLAIMIVLGIAGLFLVAVGYRRRGGAED
ncbi:MAG TPA: hypothetical protein VLW84_11650 [Terriglobales bacterium]|nr:hypothetical protein [Terriglobales bacterium]